MLSILQHTGQPPQDILQSMSTEESLHVKHRKQANMDLQKLLKKHIRLKVGGRGVRRGKENYEWEE